MPHLGVADRVKETTTTTGTGTIDLAGAPEGYQTFVAGIGNGHETYYSITNRDADEWEVGYGTISDSTPDTLSRDTVISSSNGGSLVNFSAGTKDVICTLPADRSFVIDDEANVSVTANVTATAFSGDGSSLTALNISTDLTPSLGGNLDLNSNDITGTGNIDITGSGTFSGDLTVDTDTLYVDSADNRVGILTTDPKTPLHIQKSALTGFISRTASNLTLESSGGNEIYFASGDSDYGQIRFGDTASTYSGAIQYEHSIDTMLFVANGSEKMRIGGSELVINEGGADYDFRVETNTSSNMFKVDGGTDTVSIGTSNTDEILNIDTGGSITTVQILSNTQSSLLFNDKGGSPNKYKIGTNISGNTGNFEIYDDKDSRLIATFDREGNVGIGTASPYEYAGLEIQSNNKWFSMRSNVGNGGVFAQPPVSSGNNGLALGWNGSNGEGEGNIVSAHSSSLTGGLRFHDYNSTTDSFKQLLKMTTGTTTFNEDSNDIDFRVESNTDTHALFVQGSDGNIGVGTSSPAYKLDVNGTGRINGMPFTSSGARRIISTHSNAGLMRLIGGSDNTASSYIDITGETFNADSPYIAFYNNGSQRLVIDSDGNIGINTNSPNQKLEIADTNPILRFNDTRSITWVGGEDLGGMEFYTSDLSANGPLVGASIKVNNQNAGVLPLFDLVFSTGPYNDATPVERLRIGTDVVFNETGADADFRVESDTNTHALFVDGGNNRVGILNSSPTQALDITGTVKGTDFFSYGALMTTGTPYGQIPGGGGNDVNIIELKGGGTNGSFIRFDSNNSSNNNSKCWIGTRYNGNYSQNLLLYSAKKGNTAHGDSVAGLNIQLAQEAVLFYTNSAGSTADNIERFRIGTSEVIVNEQSNDQDFRVESNNDTHALFVQGSDGKVGIGTGSPQNTLHVDSSDGTVARFISSSSSGILQVGNSQTGTGTGPELRFHHNNTLGSRIISESTEDFASTGNQSAKIKFNAKSNGNNYDMVTMIPAVNGPLVGFGTTTPNATLVAYNAANNEIARFESGDEYVHIAFQDSTSTNNPYIGAQGNNFRIITGGTERLVLDGSGNFIYNENSNDVDFRVESNTQTHMLFVDAGGDYVKFATTTNTPGYFNTNQGVSIADSGRIYSASSGGCVFSNTGGSGGNIFIFGTGSNWNTGSISTTTSNVSYNTSSDYRLKENVVEITSATERLKQLQPKRFNFIANPDTTVDGFLAHEVSDIVPEAITGTKDEVDADGNPVYQGIDHSKLVPLLVATIKELEARITALET